MPKNLRKDEDPKWGGRGKTGDVVLLKCPRHMRGYKKIWDRFAKDLAKMGITSAVDSHGLEEVVTTYSMVEDLQTQVAVEGYFEDGPTGGTKTTGCYQALLKAKTHLLSLYRQFGLVPEARGKVKMPKAEEDARRKVRINNRISDAGQAAQDQGKTSDQGWWANVSSGT